MRRDIADTLGVFRGAVPGEHGLTVMPKRRCARKNTLRVHAMIRLECMP